MPVDPSAPLALTSEARNAQRLADLERELAKVRRSLAVTVGAGGPPAGSVAPFHIDPVGHRLYVREAPGVYKSVAIA